MSVRAVGQQPGRIALLLALSALAAGLVIAGPPRWAAPAEAAPLPASPGTPAPAPLPVPRFVSRAALLQALRHADPADASVPSAPSPFALPPGGWERLRAGSEGAAGEAWLRAKAQGHRLSAIWLGGAEPEVCIDGTLTRVGASIGIFTLAGIDDRGATLDLDGRQILLELSR